MLTSHAIAALALALGLGLGSSGAVAQAAASAPAAPPAGFTAPAEPRPDDSAAQRARSQPGNNAPFWRAVRQSGTQEGVVSLPGAEKGVLIQRFVQYPGSRVTNAGEAWREVRNRWLIPYGGSLLLIMGVGLGLFYWRRGPLGGHEADIGRVIERFTPFERAAHWCNAIAFVVLAVSGIVMAFGKFFLLPVLGGTLFGWLSYALKNLHNFVGPLFAVSLVVVLATFIKDNIANAADVDWLRKAGGLLADKQVPSHRFNAMEKGLFWWVMGIPGLIVVGSGLVMDQLVPAMAYLRGDMQIAHMIHAGFALLMMLGLAGHIYMGTVGVKDAYKAMRTGYVDEGWAREHHELWYDDVKAGKIPAQRSAVAPPTTLITPSAGA
jgi:formate dehydrogenase subunit gamma